MVKKQEGICAVFLSGHVCDFYVEKTQMCTTVATDLGHPYWIYIIPTHGMHQWLLLQFSVLLMMDAESVRNM